jgi:hypothetical protein
MKIKQRFISLILLASILICILVLLGAPQVTAISTTLVINEIAYRDSGVDDAQFIEVKNVGDGVISLDSYTLELINGASCTLYDSIDLPTVDLSPNDYYVACDNVTNVQNCDLAIINDIQNGPGDVIVLKFNGTIIDSLVYHTDPATAACFQFIEGSSAGRATDDIGLSRCPDGVDSDQNNIDFTPRNTSPGAANDCPVLDSDGDNVLDRDDLCPSTVIPEISVPSIELGVNRFALVDNDFDFDTTPPKGKGPQRSYATTDTAGCSCEQIIDQLGLGKGHTKHGCSISAMDEWVEHVKNP